MIFYGTGAVEGVDVDLHSKIFPLFKKLGLPTHENWWLADSVDKILDAIRKLDRIRHDFPYETDGGGDQSGRARANASDLVSPQNRRAWAIAYKYAAERVETKLLDIIVQLVALNSNPGRDARAVVVSGSTVSRATLHNEDEIKRKDIRNQRHRRD